MLLTMRMAFILFISAALGSDSSSPCSVRETKRLSQRICRPYDCYNVYIGPYDDVRCKNVNQLLATSNVCVDRKCNLTLSNNDINILRTNSFVKFPLLEGIFLNNSKIEIIQSKTFSGLSNLTIIHLENNNITNLIKGSISSIPMLKFLNLSNNAIEQIDIGTFEDSNHVENLDLSHNDLVELSTEVLHPLYQLVILNISHNALTEIDNDFCYHLNYLKYLILDDNRISYLPNCSTNSNIEVLSLAGNALTYLNESLFPKSLKKLNLRNNRLTTINNDAFINLRILQSFYMSGNGLTEIPFELFKNMANLIVLDISHNEIQNLEYGIFYGLSNLQLLNMSYNNLERIETHIFLPLINLVQIDVSHNYIENFDIEFLLSYSHNLKMLNIGANNFSCPDLANIILYAKTKNISIPHSITFRGQCNEKQNSFVTFSNNSSNFLSDYFEKDFKKSSFYKFFKNFNSSYQDNEFKSYSKETIKIQKDLARNLSEDIRNILRIENQFFQKFLKQFSTQDKDEQIVKSITNSDSETKTENLKKFFDEFENSMNEKILKFEDQNSIQTSSALKKEDDKMVDLINTMDQLKLFFILCTLVLIALCAVKLTKYFKTTLSFDRRFRQESRELPFVDEYNTQNV